MFFVNVFLRLLTSAADAITSNSIRSLKMTNCGGRKVKSHIEGVIFDMDGTLTIPVLDFKELRRSLGINDTIDILEYANKCVGDKKQEVFRTIETFEDEGNKNLKLQPHIYELFLYLKRNQLQTALITRNNSRAVEAFFEKFLAEDEDNVFHSTDIFSQVLTRDFKPVKPDPASAIYVCSKWGIPPCNVLFVGDDLQDIVCGRDAGNVTVLKMKTSNNGIKEEADYWINDLSELIPLVKSFLK